MHRDTTTPTRYTLELDVLERYEGLTDEHAIELLRSEFASALNAAQFAALSDDIAVAVLARSRPQEGVGRYAVQLRLVERRPALSDEGAIALLQREFRRALNASHFWRACIDDFRVTVVARVRDAAPRPMTLASS